MAEFYIETTPQDNGDHLVHNANCAVLPSKDQLQYLGSIFHCSSAITQARGTFRQVNGCPQCCAPCHTA